jgi:outer membrane murein-binding lipoprotein Lpp
MWPQPCSACPAKDAEITSLTARLAASEAALATERNKLKSECEGCSRLSAAVARAEKAEYTATQVPQLRTRIQQLGTDLAAARADAVRGFAEALIAEGNEGSTDEWFRVFVRKFVARYLASLAGKEPTDG